MTLPQSKTPSALPAEMTGKRTEAFSAAASKRVKKPTRALVEPESIA